jgi:hypothetical protein
LAGYALSIEAGLGSISINGGNKLMRDFILLLFVVVAAAVMAFA